MVKEVPLVSQIKQAFLIFLIAATFARNFRKCDENVTALEIFSIVIFILFHVRDYF